jgi:hypothetical protein
MPRTRNEREDDEREERLEHMREQISSGDLVVRQMTASEREHWDEHSAAIDDRSTPQERNRRDSARNKRREQAKRQQKRRDASPPR